MTFEVPTLTNCLKSGHVEFSHLEYIEGAEYYGEGWFKCGNGFAFSVPIRMIVNSINPRRFKQYIKQEIEKHND